MKKQKGNNDLIIVSTNKDAMLSKSAKKFNTLLKKLEHVKKQQETIKARLEKNLQDVHRDIMPTYGELCELQADFLLAIIDHFNSTNLSAQNEYYIMSYVDMVKAKLMHGPYQINEEKRKKIEEATEGGDEADAELDALFDDIFGELEEDEKVEGEFEDFFQSQPLNNAGEGKTKKKSKKQLEKEAAKAQFDEEKDKSFSAMYKSLVKLLHPDGETDEELKLKKTEWMKELTVAYKNKDIQTLLRIELEWMQSDKSLVEKQSEERLAYINELLKEQVREEEYKIGHILNDPRYRILHFFAGSPNIVYFISKAHAKYYRNQMDRQSSLLQRMQSSKKEASTVIKEIAAEMKEKEFNIW
jgi:hypothetical protein